MITLTYRQTSLAECLKVTDSFEPVQTVISSETDALAFAANHPHDKSCRSP
jgi:hypothetical protein